jgi:TPR repeat protein
MPKTKEEVDKHYMERVKANDPIALCEMGRKCEEGDFEGAFGYYTKAAALGNAVAHYNLSIMYKLGKGVEKNEKREVYHLEIAAIGGHPTARYNLGCHEWNAGRIDRSTKHFIIAAKLGYDDALEQVKENFRGGYVSKEDFEEALRGHQAALDATQSEQREEAYAFFKRNGLD